MPRPNAVMLVCFLSLACGDGATPAMLQMPGQSHRDALPALTAAQREIADRLKRDVTALAGDIGDRNVFRPQQLRASVEFLASAMKDIGFVVQSQSFGAAGVRVENLEAEIKGSTKPEEILVIGAHYDSVRGCPAANDNGTGVAAVLEIARAMKDAKPARTVRFVFFVNEEPPFFQTESMGSLVHARRCAERREKIVGMISLETIGFYADQPGTQNYPPPFDRYFPKEGNFIGFVGNEKSAEFVREAIGIFRREVKFPSEGVAAPEHIAGIGFSDHWAFWQCGYPAIMITDTAMFRYPHYHTAQDTPDKIDYDRTARVVDGMISVVRELASR
jgi:hypothetical protein